MLRCCDIDSCNPANKGIVRRNAINSKPECLLLEAGKPGMIVGQSRTGVCFRALICDQSFTYAKGSAACWETLI